MSSPGWFPGDSVMATRSLDAVALGKYLQNRALTLFLAVLVLSLAVETDAYAACGTDADCPGRGAIAGDYCCGQFGCCTLPAYQLIASAHHRLQGECKQDYHDQYEECFQRIVGCTNNSTGDFGICLKHACLPPDRTNCCYVPNVAMTKCGMLAQVRGAKPMFQTLCLPVSCMTSQQAALVLEDINVLACAVLNNGLQQDCRMTSAKARCYDGNSVSCKNPYQCEAVYSGTVTALDCPWSEHNTSAPTPLTNTPSTRASTATSSTVLPSVGTTTEASTVTTSTVPGNGSCNATTPTATGGATTASAGNVTTNAAPTTSMDNVTSVAPNATASTSRTSTSNSNSTTSFTSPPTANASSSAQPSQVSSITGSSGHASTATPSSPAPSNATTTTSTTHSGVQSTPTRTPTQTPAVTVTSAKSPRTPQTSSPFSSTAPRPTPATGSLGSTVPPSPLTTDHGVNPSHSTTGTGSASTQNVSMATPTPASSNTTAPPSHAHGSQMTVMIAVGTSVGVVCTVAVIFAIAAFIKSKKYRRQAEEISSRYVHMEENV